MDPRLNDISKRYYRNASGIPKPVIDKLSRLPRYLGYLRKRVPWCPEKHQDIYYSPYVGCDYRDYMDPYISYQQTIYILMLISETRSTVISTLPYELIFIIFNFITQQYYDRAS